ncbi:MAG: TIGR03118 family protein [Opitutus sp.]
MLRPFRAQTTSLSRAARCRARLRSAAFAALATVAILPAAATARDYVQTNLTSDVPGVAAITDPHLVGVWGITHSATSPWWVNTTIGGTSLVLNGAGQPFPVANPIVVNVPAPAGMSVPSIPTGVVANTGPQFEILPNRPARFIFVTRTGTISAWNPQVNATNAIIIEDESGDADYTGATLASRSGAGLDTLYVANFKSGKIDVYNGKFDEIDLGAWAFMDPAIPDTFSVFNVQAIGSELYVTYAPKNIFTPTGGGPKQGYVDVYDVNGRLLRKLRTGPWMNAPWGVALAPDGFGQFSGRVLVAMFGDGNIAGFDAQNGNFQGMLHGSEEKPLTLEKGLWGIGFGNGGNAGPANTLYFGGDFITDGQFHGLFGTITVAPKE